MEDGGGGEKGDKEGAMSGNNGTKSPATIEWAQIAECWYDVEYIKDSKNLTFSKMFFFRYHI